MGNISSMMTKHIAVQRRLPCFAYLIIRIILCYLLWFTPAIPPLYFSSMWSAPELNTGNIALAETTSKAYGVPVYNLAWKHKISAFWPGDRSRQLPLGRDVSAWSGDHWYRLSHTPVSPIQIVNLTLLPSLLPIEAARLYI